MISALLAATPALSTKLSFTPQPGYANSARFAPKWAEQVQLRFRQSEISSLRRGSVIAIRDLAPSITLDSLFDAYVPDRCKLLKVDCEVAEHEFLPGCKSLGRVHWFSAEFHINAALTRVGRRQCDARGACGVLRRPEQDYDQRDNDGPVAPSEVSPASASF